MAEIAPRLRHVLVVDDGPWNRKLTSSLLEKLGCTVDVASGGIEAVFKILAEPFDLVLLDMHMDDLDGVAVIRKVRAGEAQTDRRTPIWALSADEPVPDSVCFDGWLVKPASIEVLRKVLAELDGFADDRDWPTLSDPAKPISSPPPDTYPAPDVLAATELAPVYELARPSMPPP